MRYSALDYVCNWRGSMDADVQSAARTELAQLRATVETQARQLETARDAMLESIGGDTRLGCQCPICKWLVSTAPAQPDGNEAQP